MPRSMPSATCRHSATPEAVSVMVMARGPESALGKSPTCHESFMRHRYLSCLVA
jgi:hypothetical protein